MTFLLNFLLLALALRDISADEVSLLSQFSESNAKFATNLYTAVIENKTDENVIISPFSVQVCGSLLFTGAAGISADVMAKGLSLFQNNRAVVGSAFQKVLQEHNSEYLQFANKIYLAENIKVKEEFYNSSKNDFLSEEENVDFSKSDETVEIINNWVKNKTNDMIKNLFKQSDFDPQSVIALVNTIYFKEKWAFPFEKTLKKSFWISENETEEIDMMFLLEEEMKCVTLDELDAKAVQLDYKNTNTSMIIILPNNRTGLQELEEKISEINLIELQNKMSSDYIELYLPKFHIDSTVNLKDTFEKMGMESIFIEGADFSNMVTDKLVKVDKAVHKAFVDVTEIGTEAGAATGFGIHDYTLPSKFVADHPFFFAIVSRTAVLFVGRYVK